MKTVLCVLNLENQIRCRLWIGQHFGDYRDHELAYGVAMARCLEEGKSEVECEKESYGDLTRAVLCHMQEIEDLSGIIIEIPGRDWPPDPIPWPILSEVSR